MRLYDEGRSPIKGKKISEIIAELTFLKGLGKAETRSKLVEQWKAVIENFFPPQIVQFTNPGGIRNGRLTIFVSGSNAIIQELTFRKTELLAQWNLLYPEEKLRGITFKQGK